jgi:undecaprenyl-diphosphatase
VIVSNFLLKGGLITALLWWIWFRDRETAERDREFVLSGIVISIATLFVARTLALLLPFRVRPRFDPALHFRMPVDLPTII